MAQEKQTLGQAIDQVVQALEPLDESARKTALIAVCAHLQINVGSIGGVIAAPSGVGFKKKGSHLALRYLGGWVRTG